MRHIIALAIASLLFAACQPMQRPQVPTPATAHKVESTALIHGRAFYLERMMLPPDAMLEVQLIDDPADARQTTTIARAVFSDLHGPPYVFALPYDPSRIEAQTRYALRAMLRDAQGTLQFATNARVPVVPGSAASVEFRLVRVNVRN
jgi:uncharacterized lipoprotein YbaY